MTPEQRDAILDSIASGVDLDRACRAAGISRRRWDERVREHADLAAMVRDAEARNRERVAAEERAKAQKDAVATPQANARDKCEWCDHERHEHDGRGCKVLGTHTRRPTRKRNGVEVCDCSRFAERATQNSAPHPHAATPSPVVTVAPVATPAPPVDPWAEAKRASAERACEEAEAMAEIAVAQSAAPEIEAPYGLDFGAISRQAAQHALGPYGFFLWLDARCAERRMPPASPFWRWSVGEWYASGKRWGFWLVGRGGGKSKMLELVSAADNFFAERFVPPGETWPWLFVSVTTTDAKRRIDGIAERIRAIGIDPREVKPAYSQPPTLTMLDVRGNDIQWMSMAGTIGNASGATANGATLDEAAKIGEKTSAGELRANPLSELLISTDKTFRSRPGTRGICCSSAWDLEGAHWKAIEEGDNEARWIARLGLFVHEARIGLEAVAAWEERGSAKDNRAPNAEAGRRIRAHAASLTERSPNVPTWVANPAYGSPDQRPWDPASAAIASRVDVEVAPLAALEGLPRDLFWFRECASVPLERGAGGVDYGAQIQGLAEANQRLVADVREAWRERGTSRTHERSGGVGGGGFTGGGGVTL